MVTFLLSVNVLHVVAGVVVAETPTGAPVPMLIRRPG